MENLGLGEMLSYKNLKDGQDPASIYSILSELKRQLDAWRRQSKVLEEQTKLKDGQLHEHIAEIEQLTEQLKQTDTLNEEFNKQNNELGKKLK